MSTQSIAVIHIISIMLFRVRADLCGTCSMVASASHCKSYEGSVTSQSAAEAATLEVPDKSVLTLGRGVRQLLTIAAPGFSVDEFDLLTVGERLRLGRRLLFWRCKAD